MNRGILPSGRSITFGIIGYPVEHTLSPAMLNAAFFAAGLDYWYLPFSVRPDRLRDAVSGMRALGVKGFNVTVPHKVGIIPFLDRLDETAGEAGAVNTVLNINDVLTGYNTDGDGLLASLEDEFGFNCKKPGTVIIGGAGGAARGAIAALCRAGASRVVILNRTREKGEELAAKFGNLYPATDILAFEEGKASSRHIEDASIFINTTTVGMKGDMIGSVNLEEFPKTTLIYDMIYSPPVTPFLKKAASLGLKTANGLGMLVCQGEIAYRIWTGSSPPKGVMREAVSKALRVNNSLTCNFQSA